MVGQERASGMRVNGRAGVSGMRVNGRAGESQWHEG